MNIIWEKLKINIIAIAPIAVIVFLLHVTLAPVPGSLLVRFVLGSLFVILGLTLFLVGVDIGITPLGSATGVSLAKSNNLWIVIAAGLILGFFISVAEPGLMVLASQVALVSGGSITNVMILVVVSIGMAIMISLGFLRIFYNIALHHMLLALYGIILLLSFFSTPDFLAIAFDASGATTGILAVPFILSLSVGISNLKKDSESAEEDSFGLVSIASAGAIIAVLALNVLTGSGGLNSEGLSMEAHKSVGIFRSFIQVFPVVLKESFLALLPLLIILLVLQYMTFRMPSRAFNKLLKGFVYAFTGLLIFLMGVNAGFMELGSYLGHALALYDSKFYVIAIGFILGLVTMLAEPAVYVLTLQIEEVTSGFIRRKAVLIPLTLGVGVAVALSIVRILIPGVQLWHYLLPGYIMALSFSFFTPKLFVGIAFDAGGVATGPMTATFILAFTQGAANAFEGADVLIDGFGMIAMVALAPIITLQMLGWIYQFKSKKEVSADESEH